MRLRANIPDLVLALLEYYIERLIARFLCVALSHSEGLFAGGGLYLRMFI